MILLSWYDIHAAITEPVRVLRGAVIGRVDCCSSVVTERLPFRACNACCFTYPLAELGRGDDLHVESMRLCTGRTSRAMADEGTVPGRVDPGIVRGRNDVAP